MNKVSFFLFVLFFLLKSSFSFCMNTEEKSEDHFRKIPPLCFQIIFSYLNPQDIGKLACVSKKLKTESEKDIHWARFHSRQKLSIQNL